MLRAVSQVRTREQERQRNIRNAIEVRRFPAFEVRRKLDKGERRPDRTERRRKAILCAGREARDRKQLTVILLAEQSWMLDADTAFGVVGQRETDITHADMPPTGTC